jgi:hypothetical protein
MRRTLLEATALAGLVATAALTCCQTARAGDLVFEFGEPYLQRIDGITPDAGNAKDVNAVTHTIDPWPRNVANRRIPANGQRMTGAVDRYRRGRLQFTPPPIAPTYATTDVKASGAATAGATGTEEAPAAATTTSGR